MKKKIYKMKCIFIKYIFIKHLIVCGSVPNNFVHILICPRLFSELVADLKVNPSTEPKTHHHKHYSTVKDAGSRQGYKDKRELG